MWNTKTQIIYKIQCGIQKHKSYIKSNVEYKNTNHNKIQCGIQKHKSYIKSNVEYKNTNHI